MLASGRTVEVNGTLVTAVAADIGAFQFFNTFTDFNAPVPTLMLDNSGDTDADGAADGGSGSIFARGYDMQFSANTNVMFLKGDLNLDGVVTFLDINPFIVVLAAGGNQPEGDTNCDGFVDFLDINSFIQILTGP